MTFGLSFVLQLNFVRYYLPHLDIKHKRVIYLDDDIIVQGEYGIRAQNEGKKNEYSCEYHGV